LTRIIEAKEGNFTMTWARAALIVALLPFMITCPPASAESLIVLLHPATKLTAADIVFDKKERGSDEGRLAALAKGKPQLVEGKSAKDAPGGRAFIIELEDPKTVSVPKVMIGEDPNNNRGGVKLATLKYNQLIVVAPFSVWHRAAAGAEPALLGRSFLWGEGAPLRSSGSGGTLTFTLTGESPEDLLAKVMRKEVWEIPELVSHALADKLIPSPGKPNVTSESVFAWAKKIPVTSKPPAVVKEGFRYKIDTSSILKSPPESSHLKVVFRPSRVLKDADGAVVVEADMWNRLPVRASGMVRRNGGKAEGQLADRARKDKQIGPLTKTRGAKFDLAPGEKGTVQFHIPKELSTEPAFFRDNEITIDLGAMGDVADARSAKQKKGNKK
jgi:hypothetical protein